MFSRGSWSCSKRSVPFFHITRHTLIRDPFNPADGEYVAFVIEIRHTKTWRILRRYRDFHDLHQKLLRIYPNMPPFPPKKYIGSKTDEFIERRFNDLVVYFKHVYELVSSDVEILYSPLLGTYTRKLRSSSGTYHPVNQTPNYSTDTESSGLPKRSDSPNSFFLKPTSHGQKKDELWALVSRFLECGNELVQLTLFEDQEDSSNSKYNSIEQLIPRALEFSLPRSRPSLSVSAVDSCFFKVLKTKYNALFQSILERNCTLLLPRQFISDSSRTYITRDLYECHSIYPVENGEYNTMDHRAVILTNDEVTTSTGFSVEISSKIVSEELIYDDSAKSLKVICIDSPLEPKIEFQELMQVQEEVPVTFPEKHSLRDYAEFLRQHPENFKFIRQVLYYMYRFNEGYVENASSMSIPVAQKYVWTLVVKLFKDITRNNPKYTVCASDPEHKNALLQILTNYIVGGCWHRLYAIIETDSTYQDKVIYRSFSRLQAISYDRLGVREEFQIPCIDAITELDLLSHCQTPMEKLVCIRSASEKIIQEIGHHQKRSNWSGEALAVSTDDMLSLFVYSVIKARPKKIQSDILFVERFFLDYGIGNRLIRDLEFYYANFQAAISYITHDAEGHFAAQEPGSVTNSAPNHSPNPTTTTTTTTERFTGRHPEKISQSNTIGLQRGIEFSEDADLTQLLDSSTSDPSHSRKKQGGIFSTPPSQAVAVGAHPLSHPNNPTPKKDNTESD